MSPVQSVQSASGDTMAALYSQMQAAQSAQAPAAGPSQDTSVHEAQETLAQTKSEAAKGDQQAARRLARLQNADEAQQQAPAAMEPAPGGNGGVNLVA